MSVQTKNYTTIETHAIIYAENTKYKRQQILYITVKIPACTQKSPPPYIQEFGATNALIDDNRYNNKIKQQLQEDARAQQANVITHQEKTKYESVRYLYGACFSPV